MKIAQVVSYQESVPPKSKNGLEFVVSWLTEELVKRGHQVTLFAPADSKTKAKLESFYPTNVNNDKNVVWYFANYSHFNVALSLSQENKFDIIHTHTSPSLFSFLFTKPVVYTLHQPYDEQQEKMRKSYLINKHYFKYLKPIINGYRKINYVTISKSQQKKFRQCEKYYFKNYTNIYNGIPVEKFTFNSQPKNYLLYLGYLSENKGAHIVVKIAKRLKRKLILAGDRYQSDPLTDKVVDYEIRSFFNKKIRPFLNRDIQYIGPVNFQEKNELFKNALCLVNPITWEEPFGLVPVEAQACGTPVVAFNHGAMSETINHNKTGFVVKTEAEMIQAIKNIDKINRKDCREWVEKNFTVERMVDDYEKLYKKLVKKK